MRPRTALECQDNVGAYTTAVVAIVVIVAFIALSHYGRLTQR